MSKVGHVRRGGVRSAASAGSAPVSPLRLVLVVVPRRLRAAYHRRSGAVSGGLSGSDFSPLSEPPALGSAASHGGPACGAPTPAAVARGAGRGYAGGAPAG